MSERWRAFKGDLAGGVTSGIVALPQTITIGALAFAPFGAGYLTFGILAGFYCSIVSGLLVALLGGTRFGVGGPRSSFSLVMALIVAALMARESALHGAGFVLSETGVARVLVLCFFAVTLAGLLQIVFGLIWSIAFTSVEWGLTDARLHWGWPLAAALVFIACGPAVLAYRSWGAGVGRAGPAVAGFFINLTPLFTALLSSAVLGEAPQLFHGLAFALIVSGIVLSSRR